MIQYLTVLGKIIATYSEMEHDPDSLAFHFTGFTLLEGVEVPACVLRDDDSSELLSVTFDFETGTAKWNLETVSLVCLIEEIKVPCQKK